jgi:HK97 family phage major capsid protein
MKGHTMSDLLKTLKGNRDGLVAEMRSHLDEAEKRDGGPGAEDDAKLRAYDTDIASLDQRMSDIAATLKRADEVDPEVQRALDASTAPEQRDSAPTDDAKLRDFLDGKTRSVSFSGGVKRDLSKATTGAGAALVPTSFYDQLQAHLIEMSGVLQAGPTLLRTSAGEEIQIPATTGHSSAALTAEKAAIAESDPVFASRSLPVYKYATLVQVSSELLTDTGVDLTGYLSMQAGRAVGNAWGAHLTTGTGSAQPQGVATAASAGVTGAEDVFIPTFDDLIDLYHSVIAPYRMSASCGWLLNDSTVASIRKIKDANEQYIWQANPQIGAPDQILGKPVYVDVSMASAAADAKAVLFGDFSTYFARQVNEVRFESSTDFAFNTDMTTFRCVVRGGGVQADTTGAIKAYVSGAAS